MTTKLPFKKGQYFEFENAGIKNYWEIIEMVEEKNFIVMDNLGKPERLDLDTTIQRINDGLIRVVNEDEIVEYCSECGGVNGVIGIHECVCK